MTPQFTTPCFVRIEDKDKQKEICKKLKEMGYNDVSTTDDVWLMTQAISNTSKYLVEYMKIAIDCGTNTDLFLALAGMREDTDFGQWFITDRNEWFLSKYMHQYRHACKRVIDDVRIGLRTVRKATATEIIEHFKNHN